MKKFTDMDIRTVGQELEFENDSLLMYTKTPVYWSRLGSSKFLTAEQQELGKEMVLDFMMEALEGTVFAFSDGSCSPLPHPPRGSNVGFLLLQCSNGVVRHPRDLQVGRNTLFLLSPHHCFIIVFIRDLIVSHYDPLVS